MEEEKTKKRMRAGEEPGTGSPCRFLKRFPPYVWICFVLVLSFQMTVFYGSRVFLPYLPQYSPVTWLDQQIPLVPEWLIVYFLSYLSWTVTVILILAENKEHGYRFAMAYTTSLFITGVIFLAWPLTMERPEITGTGFFYDWMRFLYAADEPVNFCPSLHVLISYMCFRGCMGCQKIPRAYMIGQGVFLVLVCFSVVFLKQHLLIDIPAALVVGEISLQTARLLRAERFPFLLERMMNKEKKRS